MRLTPMPTSPKTWCLIRTTYRFLPLKASSRGRNTVCVPLARFLTHCTLAAPFSPRTVRSGSRCGTPARPARCFRSARATPRSYTVEPHKQLIDTWRIAAIGASEYDVSVYGPNGFFRGFKGTISGNQRAYLAVHADYDEDSNAVRLEITNRGLRTARISVVNAYRSRSMTSMLGAGDTDSKSWSLSAAGGWYDLVITVDGDPHLEYRLAGHLEDGEDSISDPAMGGVV